MREKRGAPREGSFGVALRAPVATPQPSLADAVRYVVARPLFSKRFKQALAPMHTATSVDEMRSFFSTLPRVVELARACPRKARSVLGTSANTPKVLYASLVSLACGDDSAHPTALAAMRNLKGNHILVLSCLEKTVHFNTRGSRRLIEALFDRAGMLKPTAKLNLFKHLAMSKGLAYKATLVECFGKMMENTTPLERNQLYAALLSWTDTWKPLSPTLRFNRAVVQECLRGQIASCPVVSKKVHMRAQKSLGLSRSARA